MPQKFVIFDRDGTLIELIPYLKNTNKILFKPDLIDALMILAKKKFKFGIITNQSGIARGIYSKQDVIDVNQVILDYLKSFQIDLQFLYCCPHSPENNCKCRKPNTALGERAIKIFNIDTKKSFMVGDNKSDIEFGIRLGLRTVQIRANMQKSLKAHFYSDTLLGAANWIINQ